MTLPAREIAHLMSVSEKAVGEILSRLAVRDRAPCEHHFLKEMRGKTETIITEPQSSRQLSISSHCSLRVRLKNFFISRISYFRLISMSLARNIRCNNS